MNTYCNASHCSFCSFIGWQQKQNRSKKKNLCEENSRKVNGFDDAEMW